jgi:hypothetical protein
LKPLTIALFFFQTAGVRALYLENNFATDWIDHQCPVEN